MSYSIILCRYGCNPYHAPPIQIGNQTIGHAHWNVDTNRHESDPIPAEQWEADLFKLLPNQWKVAVRVEPTDAGKALVAENTELTERIKALELELADVRSLATATLPSHAEPPDDNTEALPGTPLEDLKFRELRDVAISKGKDVTGITSKAGLLKLLQ